MLNLKADKVTTTL